MSSVTLKPKTRTTAMPMRASRFMRSPRVQSLTRASNELS